MELRQEDIKRFFQTFKDFNFKEIKENEINATAQQVNDFYSDVYHKYKIALNNGDLFNLFDVLSPEHYEVKNCKILHWILDEKGSHGYGNAFAKEILSQADFDIYNYQVRTESCPCTKENRIDIEIDGDEFLIYIEAKINASEGVEQISRYQSIMKQSKAKNKAIFFLTKDRAKPQTQNNEKDNIYTISWNDVKDAIKSVIDRRTDFATFFIKQWSHHISKF